MMKNIFLFEKFDVYRYFLVADIGYDHIVNIHMIHKYKIQALALELLKSTKFFSRAKQSYGGKSQKKSCPCVRACVRKIKPSKNFLSNKQTDKRQNTKSKMRARSHGRQTHALVTHHIQRHNDTTHREKRGGHATST